eukprot:3692621-Rhodomonas_salina.1
MGSGTYLGNGASSYRGAVSGTLGTMRDPSRVHTLPGMAEDSDDDNVKSAGKYADNVALLASTDHAGLPCASSVGDQVPRLLVLCYMLATPGTKLSYGGTSRYRSRSLRGLITLDGYRKRMR